MQQPGLHLARAVEMNQTLWLGSGKSVAHLAELPCVEQGRSSWNGRWIGDQVTVTWKSAAEPNYTDTGLESAEAIEFRVDHC